MAGNIYKMVPIETIRGCPYTCKFCNSPDQMALYKGEGANFYRKKRMDLVYEELKHFKDVHQVEYMYFWADTFLGMNKSEFDAFCEMYKEIKLPFWMQTRPETINDYNMKKLSEVGLHRVSFGVEKSTLDNRDRRLINYLIKHRHTSTLEHNLITFKFVVPLFVRSQHHRHRTWSYNEISRRYTGVDIRFYCPDAFRTQHKSNRQASNTEELIDPIIIPDLSDTSHGVTASTCVNDHHKLSLSLYNNLINQGVCREQARGILPQNMYTEYYGTVCLNNLIKFIDLRTHDGAQWEIQRVAEACKEIAMELWPVTMKHYGNIKSEQLT